jgi:hypothetical protein
MNMKNLILLAVLIFAFNNVKFVTGQNDINNSFFDHVSYVGAFGTTDWTSGWANWDPQNTVYPVTNITISGDITTNTIWTSNNVYLLYGWVFVKNGVTLTIQAGTVIRGDKVSQGALIIERGGTLIAQGTSANPIVFTSSQAPGYRDRGDWGGLVVLGYAAINQSGGVATIEGGLPSQYGGGTSPNNADNSGILQYLRVEFPGIAFSPNNEINGITFGGVGHGTLVDYLQVSYSGDDSYEWFGGCVNCKHLIAFRGLDDEFDTDNGFTGMLQYLVALRDPAIADVSGSNGFESDNDASGSSNVPQTHPVFSNVSIYGPLVTLGTSINSLYKRSMHLRRNTSLNVFNSTFSGFPVGLYIDGAASQNNAINNILKIEHCIMTGMTVNYAIPTGGTWTTASQEESWYLDPARVNSVLTNNTDLMITDPFNLSNPNFLPMTNSPVWNASIWGGGNISGIVSYDNITSTALNNCTVNLIQSGSTIQTATTDVNGNYHLINIPNGSYTVTATTTRPWGGVTVLDVFIGRKYAATLETLTPFKILAGDINQDGDINVLDCVMIQRRVATLSAPSWTAPDWVFETKSVTISNNNSVTDIKGACSGDVHGAATPPSIQ